MFTALVLVCNLDATTPDNCYTSVSQIFYATKDECVRDIIATFDSGFWYQKLPETGSEANMVAYECVEWAAGNNI